MVNNFKQKITLFWRTNCSLIVFVALMLVFRSAVADWSDVPTGSMKPTIVEGDRILVNKMAYDIRLPFTHISLFKMADPKVNDIIIFDSKVSDNRLVKRVIGLPGDKVAMINNQLVINGEVSEYTKRASFDNFNHVEETVAGDKHIVTHAIRASNLANFSEVTVPKGHYLVLGDNRDKSADSRVIGFVPRGEIVGRSSYVAFSLDYENYLMPRSDRFISTL